MFFPPSYMPKRWKYFSHIRSLEIKVKHFPDIWKPQCDFYSTRKSSISGKRSTGCKIKKDISIISYKLCKPYILFWRIFFWKKTLFHNVFLYFIWTTIWYFILNQFMDCYIHIKKRNNTQYNILNIQVQTRFIASYFVI